MASVYTMYNLPALWEKPLVKYDDREMTEDQKEQYQEWLIMHSEELPDGGYWTIQNRTSFDTRFHEASKVGIGETKCFEFFYVYDDGTPPQ